MIGAVILSFSLQAEGGEDSYSKARRALNRRQAQQFRGALSYTKEYQSLHSTVAGLTDADVQYWRVAVGEEGRIEAQVAFPTAQGAPLIGFGRTPSYQWIVLSTDLLVFDDSVSAGDSSDPTAYRLLDNYTATVRSDLCRILDGSLRDTPQGLRLVGGDRGGPAAVFTVGQRPCTVRFERIGDELVLKMLNTVMLGNENHSHECVRSGFRRVGTLLIPSEVLCVQQNMRKHSPVRRTKYTDIELTVDPEKIGEIPRAGDPGWEHIGMVVISSESGVRHQEFELFDPETLRGE